jgi:hypothetical protein
VEKVKVKVRLVPMMLFVHYEISFMFLLRYGLDDIRITRMTREERPMKIMGSRLAYRIGINFFDWKDESVRIVSFFISRDMSMLN